MVAFAGIPMLTFPNPSVVLEPLRTAETPNTLYIQTLLLPTIPTSTSTTSALSAQAVQVLKNIQEDIVRMLTEKTMDARLDPPEAGSSSKTKLEDLSENPKYEESTMGSNLFGRSEKADTKNEAWKAVGFKYKAYGEKLQGILLNGPEHSPMLNTKPEPTTSRS